MKGTGKLGAHIATAIGLNVILFYAHIQQNFILFVVFVLSCGSVRALSANQFVITDRFAKFSMCMNNKLDQAYANSKRLYYVGMFMYVVWTIVYVLRLFGIMAGRPISLWSAMFMPQGFALLLILLSVWFLKRLALAYKKMVDISIEVVEEEGRSKNVAE